MLGGWMTMKRVIRNVVFGASIAVMLAPGSLRAQDAYPTQPISNAAAKW